MQSKIGGRNMKYATKDKRHGELYRGAMDNRTGLEIIASGERVTLEASRDAVKKWCNKKGFTIMRETYDKKTERTFFYTNAKMFFLHDGKRNMLLSD